MSDLTVELRPEDLTSSELVARTQAEIADLKRHRDPETTALKLAALLTIAAQRLRVMEESHAGSPDRDGGSDRAGAGRAARDALGYAIGGGWRSPGPSKTPGHGKASLRPH